MRHLLQIANVGFFAYYVSANAIYLSLLITAICRNNQHQHRLSSLRLERVRLSPFTPPVTLIVPAHNEEDCIAMSVRSLLKLEYPALEIVVVNDGSTDQTFRELKRVFELRLARISYISAISTAPIISVYKSATDPRLLVIDKEAAGSKADAINAGLNLATSPYVCVVDADSILERDALLRIMAGVFSDPSQVLAVGGIVRVLNGCRVVECQMAKVRLPRRSLEIFQVLEYLRAFLIGREAWAQFNLLPIISGAFGIFRKDTVKKIGGFRTDAVGEDFDLVVRLHRYLREQGRQYRIAFIPDPTCWTEVPADFQSLARQRARWQKGLQDTLWPNRDMLFRPRYGRIGSVILPYMWIFELAAPVIELAGYLTVILAAVMGLISTTFTLLFLIFGYAFATLISIGGVMLEEMTYRRYADWREVARLLFYCLVEHFPYRQMLMIWRLQGLWQYFRGDFKWRELKRGGLAQAAAAGGK